MVPKETKTKIWKKHVVEDNGEDKKIRRLPLIEAIFSSCEEVTAITVEIINDIMYILYHH